jgi:hypothetical protein
LSLHVSVGERIVTFRVLGDLSGLPPSAFDSSASLHGAEVTLEFFEAGAARGERSRAVATLMARLVAGGHREIDLVAPSADAAPAMRRVATRLEAKLPDWPSADEAFSGLSLLDPGMFYGRAGGRGYRVVAPVAADPDRHADQALVLAIALAERHDPSRSVRFHRSSRSEKNLVVSPDTPAAEYLRGAAGSMRVAPEYTAAACQQVVCVDSAEVSAHLRFPGPEYAFVVRAPREAALSLADEALALHRGFASWPPRAAEVRGLLGLSR